MKVQLKKKMLKRLVNNDKKLDQGATPLIGGGNGACFGSARCQHDDQPDGGRDGVPVTF